MRTTYEKKELKPELFPITIISGYKEREPNVAISPEKTHATPRSPGFVRINQNNRLVFNQLLLIFNFSITLEYISEPAICLIIRFSPGYQISRGYAA